MCCSFDGETRSHQIALGMHFNTRFHLRIKLLKELYTQIEAELSVYATLNKEKVQLCKFRHARSTSEQESRFNDTVYGTQWKRKLSWKRHALYNTKPLWCVKLYAEFIWGMVFIWHWWQQLKSSCYCLILPTTINDANFG